MARARTLACLWAALSAPACSDDPVAPKFTPPVPRDAGEALDAALPPAAWRDAGARDASAPLALDATSALDAARAEATVEGGQIEASAVTPDAAQACRSFVLPADCPPPSASDGLPDELRCTGLYGDWQGREIACQVLGYKPAFELWSDGAEKQRYAALPAGTSIDASDPNGFVYPVGTQFWKEFRLQTARGLRPGETRLLRKTARGWSFTSYVWSADSQSARRNDQGVGNLFETGHSVPSHDECRECHEGRPDFVLGWDWLMLGPGASGVTREDLLAGNLLVAGGRPVEPPAAGIPGDAIERAALGYLHANCGVSCHNETRRAAAYDNPLSMRLEIGELGSVQATDVARTGINHAPNPIAQAILWGFSGPAEGYYDFRPGDPARSYALARMGVREFLRQMPRLGTNKVDEQGLRIISDWVEHMTPERGYPAPAP